MTNAEARFNKSLRPRKPKGSLERTAQDVHLDSHTAPELRFFFFFFFFFYAMTLYTLLLVFKSAVCSPLSVTYGVIEMTAIIYLSAGELAADAVLRGRHETCFSCILRTFGRKSIVMCTREMEWKVKDLSVLTNFYMSVIFKYSNVRGDYYVAQSYVSRFSVN